MNFKIRQFNQESGQAVVEFDGAVGLFNVDIPIEGERYLTGEALINYIEAFRPVDEPYRQSEVDSATNVAEVVAMVEPYIPTFEENKEAKANQAQYLMTQAINSPIEFETNFYDADLTSKLNISTRALAIQTGMISKPFHTWKLANNEYVQLADAQVIQLAISLDEQIEARYAQFWQIKEQIESCQNQAELDLVEFY